MNESLLCEARAGAGFIPARVPAADRRLNLYLWLLLVVTNLVDVLGTQRAFALGIGELNPLIAAIYAEHGIVAVALFKSVFLGILGMTLPWIRGFNRALLAGACCAYLALTAAHIWYLSPLL